MEKKTALAVTTTAMMDSKRGRSDEWIGNIRTETVNGISQVRNPKEATLEYFLIIL
jgi:hypothetical protein